MWSFSGSFNYVLPHYYRVSIVYLIIHVRRKINDNQRWHTSVHRLCGIKWQILSLRRCHSFLRFSVWALIKHYFISCISCKQKKCFEGLQRMNVYMKFDLCYTSMKRTPSEFDSKNGMFCFFEIRALHYPPMGDAMTIWQGSRRLWGHGTSIQQHPTPPHLRFWRDLVNLILLWKNLDHTKI